MRLEKLDGFVELLLRRNDLALALVVVLTVSMIILPLPTALVDTLIAVNIAAAVILLLVAMYVPTPVAFSSFPSVLLIATLFRLALSISTTRLILLQADAGQIVASFGEFVVGGNIVVGLVVFLIITVVQFVVVTKGAERVAEVSARFSLDGMPGKQMAIDGDMRAGLIDMEQARQRRRTLEKESALYGSLDGAMKFVKGDAIAGIFITLINIVGGITVGMLQHDLAMSEAGSVYTVLTVGDGLVAQIPALLIAIGAGIIVTRVNGEEGGNLGEDIGRQIIAQPQALTVASAMLFGLAFVPGFPMAIFLALSAVLGLVGITLQLARRREGDGSAFLRAMEASERGAGVQRGARASVGGGAAPPLTMMLDHGLKSLLDDDGLNAEFARISERVFGELGLPAPDVQLRFVGDLDDCGYRICVHDVPVGEGYIQPGRLATFVDRETLRRRGIAAQELGPEGGAGEGALWVPEEHRGQLLEAGIAFVTPAQFLAHHLGIVMERHPEEFMGVQQARALLDDTMVNAPELVKEATSAIPLPVLAETMRRLLAEGVPVRNFGIILETVLKWFEDYKDAGNLSEQCRKALRRQISHRFSRDGVIQAITLDPQAEEAARNIHPGNSDAAVRRELLDGLVAAFHELRQEGVALPVVLVAPDFRQPMERFVRSELPYTPVLCFDDLSDEVRVRAARQVELGGEPSGALEGAVAP